MYSKACSPAIKATKSNQFVPGLRGAEQAVILAQPLCQCRECGGGLQLVGRKNFFRTPTFIHRGEKA